MLSERVSRIGESPTIRIVGLANELRRQGADVISFGVGEPDFGTPGHICDAAKRALDLGETRYTPSAGIPELRDAIASKLRDENQLDVASEDVMVSAGGKQILFEACMALLDDGDEVILPEPAWVSYDACIKLAGARTVWLGRPPDRALDQDELQKAVTDKTKMIIVNSPNNPGGYVMDREELQMVANIAVDKDLIVFSDEIYEKIIYDKEHVSIASMSGMGERTITANGFSKTYAMTGWRLGYATAPKPILKEMMKIQGHSVTCATSFVQHGGVAALTDSVEGLEMMVKEFRARRDIIVNGLNELGFSCPMPDGAFYVFPDVSSFGTGDELAEKLLSEVHVAATPGSAFGPHCENYLRMSYATSQDRIKEGLERMAETLG